jgi:hypothetical protein
VLELWKLPGYTAGSDFPGANLEEELVMTKDLFILQLVRLTANEAEHKQARSGPELDALVAQYVMGWKASATWISASG